MQYGSTEQVGLPVTLWTCVRKVLRSNLGPRHLTEVLCRFRTCNSLHANAAIETRLGHDRFLPKSFQFFSHPIIRCTVVQLRTASLDNELKKYGGSFARNETVGARSYHFCLDSKWTLSSIKPLHIEVLELWALLQRCLLSFNKLIMIINIYEYEKSPKRTVKLFTTT
jgi:hypothetical protein